MTNSLVRFGKAAVHTIGTHSGKFHCDDVLAVAMLRYLPECVDSRVVRSRDEHVLAQCDVVVDVGGVYDPASHRYDHHQRGFDESRRSLTSAAKNSATKLSSAGLVYHHFGRDVLRCVVAGDGRRHTLSVDELEALYDQVYEHFVEEVDAVDNGLDQYQCAGEQVPLYRVTSTLSQRVANMNRAWNEQVTDAAADDLVRFNKAVQLVGGEFSACVCRLCDVWLPARAVVRQCWSERHMVHASGRLMKLPSGAVPWKQQLFTLESGGTEDVLVHFVVYPDTGSSTEQWRVQAVPPTPSSFDMRTPLKASWRGLRQEELSSLVGVDDCVFVHSSGFIGGAGSLQSVIHMAVESLKANGVL